MFIVWGTKGITSVVKKGSINCPTCNLTTSYELKEVNKYFTLFWIPLIPLGSRGKYLECQRCKTAFNPECFSNVDHGNDEQNDTKSDSFVSYDKMMRHFLSKDLDFGKYCSRISDDGHFVGAIKENVEELEKTFSREHCIGIDRYGLYWFARMDQGYEIWGVLKDKIIVNGGAHRDPRIINFGSNDDHEIQLKLTKSESGKFNLLQTFCICYLFLEKQWEKSANIDWAWILSGLTYTRDGLEVDPRFHREFEECAAPFLEENSTEQCSFGRKETFRIMCNFLKMKLSKTDGEEGESDWSRWLKLLDYDAGCPMHPIIREEWLACCDVIAKGSVPADHFLLKLERENR